MSLPGIFCGVVVNVVRGVSAAAQAVSNPESRRRLVEAIRYQAVYMRGRRHGGRGGALDHEDSEPLVCSGEGGRNTKYQEQQRNSASSHIPTASWK
jgi:hypothetical protein